MNAKPTCPKCGAPLSAGSNECQACLLSLALPEPSRAESATLHETPPSGSLPNSFHIKYFGDYELIEEIARGGMGVVYKARQVSLNRLVAVKMILNGALANEAEVKRFHTEAEAAANLHHPNIVSIHEVGQHEGQYYFSMDLIEGRNLAEFLRSEPVPFRAAAEMLKTMAEAIHFAHQRGTLHRDLKPENVLVEDGGRLCITDFGLAKKMETADGLTRSKAILGSPSYMSPEQAAGKSNEVGPGTDVYSLGAILYEMLTGQPPFKSDHALGTLVKVMQDEPVAPGKLRNDLPDDLETICLKCLEKSPERRYFSAKALAEELGRFLNGEPVMAKRASAWRKAWSWSHQHPWAWTGVALSLLVGLSGLAFGLWEQTRYLQNKVSPGSHTPLFDLSMDDSYMPFLFIPFVLALYAPIILFFDMVRRQKRNLPITPQFVWAAGLLSALQIGLGLALSFAGIGEFVWGGSKSWTSKLLPALGLPFLTSWFGMLLSFRLVQHQRARWHGISYVEPSNKLSISLRYGRLVIAILASALFLKFVSGPIVRGANIVPGWSVLNNGHRLQVTAAQQAEQDLALANMFQTEAGVAAVAMAALIFLLKGITGVPRQTLIFVLLVSAVMVVMFGKMLPNHLEAAAIGIGIVLGSVWSWVARLQLTQQASKPFDPLKLEVPVSGIAVASVLLAFCAAAYAIQPNDWLSALPAFALLIAGATIPGYWFIKQARTLRGIKEHWLVFLFAAAQQTSVIYQTFLSLPLSQWLTCLLLGVLGGIFIVAASRRNSTSVIS